MNIMRRVSTGLALFLCLYSHPYAMNTGLVFHPDFILHNGLIIETKGRFTSDDRRKHIAIKKQHPELDIRFVFENSKRKLSKGAKNTYATWCERNMFLYADRVIPEEWLSEKGKDNHPDLVEFPYEKIKRR